MARVQLIILDEDRDAAAPGHGVTSRRWSGRRRDCRRILQDEGDQLPTLNIFVSFEFDKDNNLKNNFLRQAKENTQHRVRNCSQRVVSGRKLEEEGAGGHPRVRHGSRAHWRGYSQRPRRRS